MLVASHEENSNNSWGMQEGSCFELESQVIIARNLKYLAAEDATAILRQIEELGRILNGLLKSLERDAFTSH